MGGFHPFKLLLWWQQLWHSGHLGQSGGRGNPPG